MLEFGSSFELAFRRSLFSFILFSCFLLIGSLLLSWIIQFEQSKQIMEICKSQAEFGVDRRLEFERVELLNTLRAESMTALSESEWHLVANTKLDAYERMLSTAHRGHKSCRRLHNVASSPFLLDFSSSFRTSLLLLTTIGGGPLKETSPFEQPIGLAAKLFCVMFASIGIPLFIIHVGNCAKAILAFVEANFGTQNKGLGLVVVCAIGFGLAGLLLDILLLSSSGQEEPEESFLDLLFAAVFLVSFTISDSQLYNLPAPLLFPLLLFLLSFSAALLFAIKGTMERWLATHEFDFVNGFCGKVERAVSGARLDSGEAETVDEVTKMIRFELGESDESFDVNDETTSTTLVPRTNVVEQTIREEETEQEY